MRVNVKEEKGSWTQTLVASFLLLKQNYF